MPMRVSSYGRISAASPPNLRQPRYHPLVDVAFYANLRAIVGTKHVTFDLPPNSTVLDLLHLAETRYPEFTPLLWDANGNLGDYIKVFVNGREIRHLQGVDTLVPSDAEVDIFPPSAGG